MENELKLFEFLEKEKGKLYQKENQNSQLKTIQAQLKLLKKIYIFCGFGFQRVAFLRKDEKKWVNGCFKELKKQYPNRTDSDIESHIVRQMRLIFLRMKRYDVLKIKDRVYTLHINSKKSMRPFPSKKHVKGDGIHPTTSVVGILPNFL